MSTSLRAITVCVEFHDFLALTLPYNAQHFQEYYVVTSLQDEATAALCHTLRVDHKLPVYLIKTNQFYEDGAQFNKYAAIESALDLIERKGWLVFLDADVRWPHSLGNWTPEPGYLYTPYRRMFNDLSQPLPDEKDWHQHPVHPNTQEWAGYSQIFHASDPFLGPPPWHEINWRHAGGGDSFFQAKWPASRKVRPPWHCLHLGPGCLDWCGRVRPFLDGTVHPQASQRYQNLRDMIAQRRQQPRGERFRHEKI